MAAKEEIILFNYDEEFHPALNSNLKQLYLKLNAPLQSFENIIKWNSCRKVNIKNFFLIDIKILQYPTGVI